MNTNSFATELAAVVYGQLHAAGCLLPGSTVRRVVKAAVLTHLGTAEILTAADLECPRCRQESPLDEVLRRGVLCDECQQEEQEGPPPELVSQARAEEGD